MSYFLKCTKIGKIANYIVSDFSNIATNRIEGDLTNLKLQKLLYYIQILSLKKLNKLAFDNTIEAWDYGPVVPCVYQEYKNFGRNVLDTENPNLLLKPLELKSIVDDVIEDKGKYTGIALMKMTHQDKAWKIAYDSKDKIITKELLKQEVY